MEMSNPLQFTNALLNRLLATMVPSADNCHYATVAHIKS